MVGNVNGRSGGAIGYRAAAIAAIIGPLSRQPSQRSNGASSTFRIIIGAASSMRGLGWEMEKRASGQTSRPSRGGEGKAALPPRRALLRWGCSPCCCSPGSRSESAGCSPHRAAQKLWVSTLRRIPKPQALTQRSIPKTPGNQSQSIPKLWVPSQGTFPKLQGLTLLSIPTA